MKTKNATTGILEPNSTNAVFAGKSTQVKKIELSMDVLIVKEDDA